MLENPTPAASAPDSTATTVKRYAPPNQRNRSLSRRKSGERFDRASSLYVNDADKTQPPHATSKNLENHGGDVGSINFLLNDNSRSRSIPLEGCSRSEASQLLNDRWATIMHDYNDTSIDLSERPVMYSASSASAWGQFKLPHQLLAQANSVGAPGAQMDFLNELRLAIRNANGSYEN